VTRRRSVAPGPSDPWTEALLALAILSALGSLVGLLIWVSGVTVSTVTGHGSGPSPVEAAQRLLDGGTLAQVWPGVPVPVIISFALGVATSLICTFVWQ
jgi:hypothetical protein